MKFKITRGNSGWLLNALLEFDRSTGGGGPDGDLAFGPDGNLYGAVGTQNGFGAIFKLQPPASPCKTAVCYWTETVLYRFVAGPDGHQPNGNLIFDAVGDIYGTTETGGANGYGVVFKLTRSGGSWTESIIYNFMGGNDGVQPQDGVVMDGAGNFFGTTRFGGSSNCNGGCGTVFELSPAGGGWTERVIYRFQGPPDGAEPWVGLTRDSVGNLYGTNTRGGANDGGNGFRTDSDGWLLELQRAV